MNDFLTIKRGPGPIIAVANHHGCKLRPEVARIMALDADSRLREEDPFTGDWANVVPTSLVAEYSRFQVDLNRPRESAVYLTPDDAWGLQVWSQSPSADLIERSLAEYDAYYTALEGLCREKQEKYGAFVVLDLHSYNFRRNGPQGPVADPAGNPEVNIGTGTMNRERWGGLVDRFMIELQNFDFLGRRLDVRENVKFVGRQFPKWVHSNFPESGCAIAIELKKFFMDEWTGTLDMHAHNAVLSVLAAALPGLEDELGKVSARHGL